MPRNLITPNIIAKESLFHLQNHLVFGANIHREYKDEFVKIGRSVSIRKPNKFVAKDGAALDLQEIDEDSIDITIDQRKHVAWDFDSEELTMEVEEYSHRYIEPAVIQLANQVDVAVAQAGARKFFMSSGVPGSTPGNFDALADAAVVLDEYSVPDDGYRKMVLNPRGRWAMTSGLQGTGGVFNADIQRDLVRKGRLGELAQFDLYGTQNIAVHQRGNFAGAPLVNQGAFAPGSSQIALDGLTGTQINVGDVFTIDGVFGVNPVSRESTGQLQQFVVTGDAAVGGGQALVQFYPAIEDGTGVDREAYQNVTALPADNAAVTFLGASGGSYPQNLAYHKNALALVTIPLKLPESVTYKARMDWEGYSIRVVKDYDIQNDKEIIRLDIFFGVEAIYPELGCRVWG